MVHGAAEDLDRAALERAAGIVPLSLSLARTRSIACSPTYWWIVSPDFVSCVWRLEYERAVERRRAIDRHPVERQHVAVLRWSWNPACRSRRARCPRLFSGSHSAGVSPVGLLQRIGWLMSNLIVKSSSSTWMLV